MLSTDHQASLEAGQRGAQETGPAGDGARAPAPSASLFALPRGGARERLLAAARRQSGESADAAAPAPLSAAVASAPEDAPAPAGQPLGEGTAARDPLLYSKGDASASGFRPWYWSYERDGRPPQSDSAGTVTPFPASAPSPVSLPDPVSAPATRPSSAKRRTPSLALRALAVLGALALTGGGALFLLPPAPPQAEAPTLALIAPPPPAVPESVPPPRPTESVPPAKPATAPAADPVVAPADIAAMMTRGDQLLATGDIAAARLFYERAAEGGSAAAATAAGKTYDPIFLAAAQARGIRGDPVAAARWYRKASAAGDKEADGLMQRLMAKFAG